MEAMPPIRNLHFGLLALQDGLVNQVELVDALEAVDAGRVTTLGRDPVREAL